MSRGYILVVDDDALLAELAMAVLQQDGYETRVAVNGGEALQLIEKRIPDLIILDANMPVLDGFGVLAALKADSVLKRIPVVMLTALRSEADVAKARHFKVDGYVAKPFEPDHLRQRVAVAIQHRKRERGVGGDAAQSPRPSVPPSNDANTESEFLD